MKKLLLMITLIYSSIGASYGGPNTCYYSEGRLVFNSQYCNVVLPTPHRRERVERTRVRGIPDCATYEEICERNHGRRRCAFPMWFFADAGDERQYVPVWKEPRSACVIDHWEWQYRGGE